MAVVKGKNYYKKFKQGKKLTHKQAILAQCYMCNGMDEGNNDCGGISCPLYQFHYYRSDNFDKK